MSNLRNPAYTQAEIDAMVADLEAAGYVVGQPGSRVIEPERALNDQLLSRMELLTGNLHVIDGMTKRGAALPLEYRTLKLPPIYRYTRRLFEALLDGGPCVNPWDVEAK